MSREKHEQSAEAYYKDTFGYQAGNPDDTGAYPGEPIAVRVKKRKLIEDVRPANVILAECLADKPF